MCLCEAANSLSAKYSFMCERIVANFAFIIIKSVVDIKAY